MFNDGSVSVPVYADPAGTPNGINTTDALTHMAVKRIIALTQSSRAANGYKDGSLMNDVIFTSGQLFKSQRDATGAYNYVPVQGGWPLSAVDPGQTGYDTGIWAYSPSLPGNDKRRWIVDFDFDGMSQPLLRGLGDLNFPNGEYRDNVTEARYNKRESVTITLGVPPGHVKGESVRSVR